MATTFSTSVSSKMESWLGAGDEFGLSDFRQHRGAAAGARYFPADVVSKNLALMQLVQKLRHRQNIQAVKMPSPRT